MAEKRPTIVITQLFRPEVIRRELAPHARIVLARTPAEWREALPGADALIARFWNRIGEAELKHAARLRVLGNFAVGVDNIDLGACARRGIPVVNTPGVLTQATAEHALALLLATARRIPEGDAICRSGRFRSWSSDELLGLELRGRQAVLVGQGRIGNRAASLFRGIGLRVQWITREDSESQICRKLRQAQVLSLHMNLNPSSRHWLNRARLKLLPPDAIVVNTARGPVIDENALIQTLKHRRIFGAGLDVYEDEPRIPLPLRRLPNVVLMPHTGSATRKTRDEMASLLISGVLGVLSGKRPGNLVKFSSSWEK